MKSLRFVRAFFGFVFTTLVVATSAAQFNSVTHPPQPNGIPQTFYKPPMRQTTDSARHRQNLPPSGSGPLILLPAVNYTAGYCFSLIVADVNGDGKPDLIAACYGGMMVLLGNGDGTFQPAVFYSSGGEQPFSFAVGDLNHDGKLDLIAANSDTGVVGVLLGNGDGTFKPVVTYPSGGFLPMGVAVGDVNNDGRQDVVVINQCAIFGCTNVAFAVLFGNGDGSLQAATIEYLDADYPNSLVIGDANGDGNLDVFIPFASTGDSDGFVQVFLGNGDGNFAGAQYGWKGSGPLQSLAIADFNGDGHLDLVAAGWGSPAQIGVFLGNGDGTFQSALTSDTQLADLKSVAVGDVNGDGHPDLLAMGSNIGGAVALLIGNGNGSFQTPTLYNSGGTGENVGGLAVVDLNGDGLPDVLVANSANSVGVLVNNSNAPPSITSLTSSANPVDLKKMVTYTAQVATHSGGTLRGSVTFEDGGYPIATVTVANNQASFSTSYLRKQLGAHTITATYGGEYQVATGSISAPLTQYVRDAVSKTALTSSGSPSKVGQSVTFRATTTSHSGKIPDGETVTFATGKTILGTGSTSNGAATFTTSFSKAKTYLIKATYGGDNVFEPSTGTFKQIVTP